MLGVHRKVYLPTYGLFDEGRFTRAGDQIRTVEVGEPLQRIGLSVCEDFWHPSLPMLQAQDGASCSSTLPPDLRGRPGAPRGWRRSADGIKMQETYALLGTVAVAFCNRVGNEEGLTFWGGSRLLGADGSVIVEAPLYEEALVVGALAARRPAHAALQPPAARRRAPRARAARAGPDHRGARRAAAAGGGVVTERAVLPRSTPSRRSA